MTALETLLNETKLDSQLKTIGEKVFAGKRISVDEAEKLYYEAELAFLGALANSVRIAKNGNKVFFNRNFHIEPTNLCVFDCKFCSYSKNFKQRPEAWEMTIPQMVEAVKKYDGIPVTEVHIVGGVHPKMDLQFFADLIKEIKAIRPDLHIKAFTAVEYEYMFRKAKVSIEEGLKFLIAAGLNSIPGGGAEIFDEEIRNQICADKCSSAEWLEIHEKAHRLGLRSNATMLYGHYENYGHRIDHMNRLRELQDRTGGFQTFIPLKFRNKDNQMSHLQEVNVLEDLKCYAMARIFLDNFDHVKAYWPMLGRNTACMTLHFGVDDLDGTIDDSTKIYSMAGSEEQNPSLSTDQLVKMIQKEGRIAVERDTLYNEINVFV